MVRSFVKQTQMSIVVDEITKLRMISMDVPSSFTSYWAERAVISFTLWPS